MSKLNTLSPFLKLSTKRKKILFFIVFLSMTIITLLSILVQSGAKSYFEYECNQSGEQHSTFYNVNSQQVLSLENHELVKKYGVATILGSASESLKWGEGKVLIGYLDDNYSNLRRVSIYKGRMPEESDEIALSTNALELLKVDAKINDSFILPAEYKKSDGGLIKEEKSYKLVGIIHHSYKNHYYYGKARDFFLPSAIVSKSELERLSSQSEYSYHVVTKNNSRTYDTFQKIAKDLSLVDNGVYNDEVYDNIGVIMISLDLLLHSNSVVGRLVLFLGAFVLSTILSLITIISLEFKRQKQQVGLIRALGGTNKQLASIMTRSTLPTLCKAMPLGIILGIILSRFGYTYFAKRWYFFRLYNIDVSTIIFAILTGLISVIGTIFLTVDSLCNVSPIKGVSRIYKSKISKRKALKANNKNQKLCYLYAKRDLGLNKSKSLLTVLSLSISFSICLSLFVYINDYNYSVLENPIKGVEVDIFRNSANALALELSYDEQLGIGAADMERLGQIPGVDHIIKKHFYRKADYLLAVDKTGLGEYLKILKADVERPSNYFNTAENYKKLLKLGLDRELVFLGSDRGEPCVETYDDKTFMYLEQHLAGGDINLKALKEGTEVVLCLPPFKANPERYSNRFAQKVLATFKGKHLEYQESNLRVGDTVTLVRLKPADINNDYYKTKDDLSNLVLEQRQVKIGGIVKKAGYFKQPNGDYHKILSTPLVYVHNNAMAKWTGIEQYNKLDFVLNNNANDLEVVNNVRNILSNYDRMSIRSETEARHGERRVKLENILLHIPILLVISVISILTIWITIASNYEVKKRQFGLLRSVGLTKKQFKKILNYQAIFYGITSSLLAAMTCIVYSLFLYYQFNPNLLIYQWWHLVPWSIFPILALTATGLVYFINNAQFRRDLKHSIAENMQYID